LYEKMGSSDDATEKMLLATTKQCPGCKVRITKNKACNHMTCANCRHQFCWVCKGDWKEHGGQTGGYYVCKKYNENVAKGIFSDEEKAMTDQQTYLQSPSYVKYIFFIVNILIITVMQVNLLSILSKRLTNYQRLTNLKK